MIFAAKMENFLLNLDGRPVGMPLRDRWPIYEPIFAILKASNTNHKRLLRPLVGGGKNTRGIGVCRSSP